MCHVFSTIRIITQPVREEGTGSISITIYLDSGVLNIVNLYTSKNSFNVSNIPECIYNDVTLIAGDLNARHAKLGHLNGFDNSNGKAFYHFVQDHPEAHLLGAPCVPVCLCVCVPVCLCDAREGWRASLRLCTQWSGD